MLLDLYKYFLESFFSYDCIICLVVYEKCNDPWLEFRYMEYCFVSLYLCVKDTYII
jgi:hypothetical protein